MPKEEASDATFARLLVGAVFTMPAEGGAGLPSANVSSAILRAAGGGLGANGFAALVARAQSLPLQRVALVGTLSSVGGPTGARRYIVDGSFEFSVTLAPEVGGLGLSVATRPAFSAESRLREEDVFVVTIPAGSRRIVLCLQGVARPRSAESASVISSLLASSHEDSDSYRGPVGPQSLRVLPISDDRGLGARRTSWGSLKILYR